MSSSQSSSIMSCLLLSVSTLLLSTFVHANIPIGATTIHQYPTTSLSKMALLRSVRRKSRTTSSICGSYGQAADQKWLYDNDTPYVDEASSTLHDDGKQVQLCSTAGVAARFSSPFNNPLVKNLIRGAFLRVASDLSGGTPLENIKCRVTASPPDGPIKATKDIMNAPASSSSTRPGGILNLWSGTPSRTVEGALLGAVFLVGSAATKKRVLALTGSKTIASLTGGVVGGMAQAVIMTPAGMVFTSLNVNKGKPGYENDNALTITKRIIDEKGIMGMFAGGGPMAARQASNWASRSLFTEICRTNLKLSRFGLMGEIASGCIGGIGSCWNTPIETVRVLMQRDIGQGKPALTFNGYIEDIRGEYGIPGLFRGVTPRAVQACVQTTFMVVVPNLLGL